MEQVRIEEKIRTNTIPGQVVGALQHYAQNVSAFRGVLFDRGKWETVIPVDTVGVPVTHDLRLEATGFLINEFNALAAKLAIESATAQENRETTRAIGPTVLNRISAVEGTTKIAQSTPVACRSTARSLLKFATGWAGDDLPALLKEVRKTRSKSSL